MKKMTDSKGIAPRVTSDTIEFVPDDPHQFNQGDHGETLREIVYENETKTIVIKKGTQFVVQRNGGRIIPVIFRNTPEAVGEFMVYNRHAKKIKKS